MNTSYSNIFNMNKYIAPTSNSVFGVAEMRNMLSLDGSSPLDAMFYEKANIQKYIIAFKNHFQDLIKHYLGVLEYYNEHKELFNKITDGEIPVELKHLLFGMAIACNKSITYNFRCGHKPIHSGKDKFQSVYGILENLICKITLPAMRGKYVTNILGIVNRYLAPVVKEDGSIIHTDELGYDHTLEPRLFPKLGYVRKHDINLSAQAIQIIIPDNFANDFLIPTFDHLSEILITLRSQVFAVVYRNSDELGMCDISDLDKIQLILTDICNYHHSKEVSNSNS